MKTTITLLILSSTSILSAQSLRLDTISELRAGNDINLIRTSTGEIIRVSVSGNGNHPSIGLFGGTGNGFEIGLNFSSPIDYSEILAITPITDIDTTGFVSADLTLSGGTITDLNGTITRSGSISVVINNPGASLSFAFQGEEGSDAQFQASPASNVGAGSFTNIEFATAGGDFIGSTYSLTGFTVTSIPEPSSPLLIGLGSLCFMARRKRS